MAQRVTVVILGAFITIVKVVWQEIFHTKLLLKLTFVLKNKKNAFV